GAGGRKHFPHARSAFRAFAADDDDVTFFHRAVEDGFERLLLGLEHDGFAGEAPSYFAGDFRDSTSGGKVAVENDDVAVLFDGLVERLNDGLTGRIRLHVSERLGHGLAGDGERVAVEQAGVEQRLHERTDAADGDKFGHDMFAAGLEVGEHGHAFADARGHRVVRVHAAARAGSGNGALFDGLQSSVVNFSRSVLTDGFEDGDDVEQRLRHDWTGTIRARFRNREATW